MMVVMPAFPHAQYPKKEVVPALVFGAERPAAPQVTNGIDAPGRMVDQEDACKSTPDESQQDSPPRPRRQAANRGRYQQAENNPEGKQPADCSDQAIWQEISDIAVQVRTIGGEQPANVRMPDVAKHREDPRAVEVW